jgi:hypothetical protein
MRNDNANHERSHQVYLNVMPKCYLSYAKIKKINEK